jgi:hypothetical protein
MISTVTWPFLEEMAGHRRPRMLEDADPGGKKDGGGDLHEGGCVVMMGCTAGDWY